MTRSEEYGEENFEIKILRQRKEHLAILKQGAEAWNTWKREHWDLRADLLGADLIQANLAGFFLQEVYLDEANLQGTDLRGADLAGASLREAKLGGTKLIEASLCRAYLLGADLTSAVLCSADLRQASLIDARFDGADLTGAKLWEAQRTGWSIKGVICRRVFWDRKGIEPTEYEEGEFERLFAERPRIILRYPGGVSMADLAMLPLIVERLQVEHPGCALHLRSVQDDGSGAAVTITVEDLASRDVETFTRDVEALRGDLLAIERRLHEEKRLRLSFESRYQAVVQDILPMLLAKALPKQEFNIGQLTAPMVVESTAMSRDTYNIQSQVGAVGPVAHAHDMAFWQVQGGLDLPKLADELLRLRAAMKGETEGLPDQDEAVSAVAAAEKAAKQGDEPAVLRHLKAAGGWALGIAEKIGVTVAAKALEKVTLG